MESLHFQLFQSVGGLFGFLRYAEKVGEHKTGRIGEQQAAGVDKPLLVCDYGQHQDAAHGLRSGAYVTKGGNERTADTGTQALLMAPTEVLARQHGKSLGPWLDAAGITWGVLTGSTPAAEREELLAFAEKLRRETS